MTRLKRVKNWPPEEPFLVEAYVFGDVLEGIDPLDAVQVALVLNLLADQVPWESNPHGTGWLADELRLSKGGFAYWWRSRHAPVWNHRIRGPVRFWSKDGPDHEVLQALAQRRLETLPRIVPPEEEQRRRHDGDLGGALAPGCRDRSRPGHRRIAETNAELAGVEALARDLDRHLPCMPPNVPGHDTS